MTPPHPHESTVNDDSMTEAEEEAQWDAMFAANADALRAMGEKARAAYEAGKTLEMDFEDEYLGLGKDPEDV